MLLSSIVLIHVTGERQQRKRFCSIEYHCSTQTAFRPETDQRQPRLQL